MKVRYVFYMLLLVICVLIPFHLSSTVISFHSQTPCIRIKSWSVGQSSGYYGKEKLAINIGSFITNSEQTCCVHVSVGYCDDQPSQTNIMYPITSFGYELSMSHGFVVEKAVYSVSGPDAALFDPATSFSVSAKFKGPKDEEELVSSCNGNNGRDNKPMWVKVKFIGYYGTDLDNQKSVSVSGQWVQDTKDRIRQEYVDMTPPDSRAELPVPGRSSFVSTISTDNGVDRWNTGHYSSFMIDDGLKGKKADWLAEVNKERKSNGLSAFTDADFQVNSAYRNPYHQRFHVGKGALASFHSRHPFGDALDVHTPDVNGNGTEEQVYKNYANSADGVAMENAATDKSVGALWTASYLYYGTHTHADWTLRVKDGGSWPPPNGTVYSPPCNIDGTASSGPYVTGATTGNAEETNEGQTGQDTGGNEQTTDAPAIGPCGHTYWLGSSSDYDHRSETWGCGHTIYVCQSSSHSLQASCSETNANGDSCTVTSFYACQTHTHEYPAAPSFAPSLSVGSSSYSAGSSLSPVVTSDAPIYGAHLFVRAPGDTSTYGTKIGWFPGGRTTQTLTLPYTFAANAASGSYKITARVYPWNGDAWGDPDYLSDYVSVE